MQGRDLRRGSATWLLLSAGIGGWVLLSGSGKESGSATNQPASRPNAQAAARSGDQNAPADTATARQSSFNVSVLATGDLFALEQVEVRNELGQDAKILELIAEGALVKAGDTVATLSTEELDKQIKEEASLLETAKADLVAAEGNLEIQLSENEAALRKAQVTHELAVLDLRKWSEGEVPSRRQKLAVQMDEATTELSRTTEKLRLAKGLKEKGFISSDDLQAAELAARKADGQLRTAELDSTMFEQFEQPKELRTKQNALADAEGELDRTAKKNRGQQQLKHAELANKKRQLELRLEQSKRLAETHAKATLKSPVAGLVIYTSTINRWITDDNLPWRVGKTIHPGQPLIALPEISSLVAKVSVAEALSGRIRAGQAAVVKVDARGGKTLTGKVRDTGLMAEQQWGESTRSLTIRIDLGPEAATLALRPSMRVETEIIIERAENVLAIPVTAVFAEGALRFAYVFNGSKLSRTPVKLGRKSDRLVEVTAGIKDGQTVLIRDVRPDEYAAAPWTDAQLEAGGCKRNNDGTIVAMDVAEPSVPESVAATAAAEKLPAGAGVGN